MFENMKIATGCEFLMKMAVITICKSPNNTESEMNVGSILSDEVTGSFFDR